MAKQGESRLQRRIRRRLEKEVGGWWVKFWGGPFTPAGVPDLLGCVDGLFFALEVKRPGEDPSAIQLRTIRLIVMRAGGVSTIVESPEEAVYVVRRALAEAARGSRVRVKQRRSRAVVRAKNR